MDAGVDRGRPGADGEGPARQRPERAWRPYALGHAEAGGADSHVDASAAPGDGARIDGDAEVTFAQARVAAGAREPVVDVGLRVVVAEDRLGEVAVGVAQQRAQVVGGRGDRVGGVVDVPGAVPVAVDAVALPGPTIAITNRAK